MSYFSFLRLYENVSFDIDSGNLDYPTVAYEPWTDIRSRDDMATLNLTFPYGQIPPFYQQQVLRAYYASVTYIDQAIGVLLNTLKKRGYDKNTIVTLVGDHGWTLGEHHMFAKYSNFDTATSK